MSFFTCFCDFPQNEHLRSSPPSPNFATLVTCFRGPVRDPSFGAQYVAFRATRWDGLGEWSSCPNGSVFDGVSALDDLVDHAVLLGVACVENEVAVLVDAKLLGRLAGVFGEDLLEK